MPIAVSRHSRLRFGEVRTLEGIEFFDVLDLPLIPAQPDDLSYTVLDSDRIDVLAYKFYGSPTLWWVIAAVNGLEILPTELHAGALLRIPSPRFVTQELFKPNPNRPRRER